MAAAWNAGGKAWNELTARRSTRARSANHEQALGVFPCDGVCQSRSHGDGDVKALNASGELGGN
jgi:hypothetical protein